MPSDEYNPGWNGNRKNQPRLYFSGKQITDIRNDANKLEMTANIVLRRRHINTHPSSFQTQIMSTHVEVEVSGMEHVYSHESQVIQIHIKVGVAFYLFIRCGWKRKNDPGSSKWVLD